MPKSHRNRRRRNSSRRSTRKYLAGGSGAAAYVSALTGAGPAQFSNVYENSSHMNSPTGGGMWLSNGSNVAFQAPAGSTPLMSGGRRRKSGSRGRKSRGKKKSTSWLSKYF